MEKAQTIRSELCQAAAATCEYFEGVESFCWTPCCSNFRADFEGSTGVPRRDDAEAAAHLISLQVGGKGKSQGRSIPATQPIYPLTFEGFWGGGE